MSYMAGPAPEDDDRTELLTGGHTPRRGFYPPQPLSELRAMWRGDHDTLPVYEPSQPTRRPKRPRPAIIALPGMVLLAGLAAFFCWVSAEPLWIAVGHSVEGTVRVSECGSSGGCEGEFHPTSGGDPIPAARVTGEAEAKRTGEVMTARAASDGASTVYVGGDSGLWWRAGSGLAMVLSCGIGIAAVTGAWRWTGGERWASVSASVGAPLLLWLGALALAW